MIAIGSPLVALTQPAAAQAVPSPSHVGADFDNDGFADLAVGVPGESVGGEFTVGAVNVVYGSASEAG